MMITTNTTHRFYYRQFRQNKTKLRRKQKRKTHSNAKRISAFRIKPNKSNRLPRLVWVAWITAAAHTSALLLLLLLYKTRAKPAKRCYIAAPQARTRLGFPQGPQKRLKPIEPANSKELNRPRHTHSARPKTSFRCNWIFLGFAQCWRIFGQIHGTIVVAPERRNAMAGTEEDIKGKWEELYNSKCGLSFPQNLKMLGNFKSN